MPRLPHGEVFTLEDFREAREDLREQSAESRLGFATVRPIITQDFGFLFPGLQRNPANLLPEGRQTRDGLVALGKAMLDAGGAAGGGNSRIPAAYTYFGQFVDHDITFETASATLPQLLDPDLAPLPRTGWMSYRTPALRAWSWTASMACRRRARVREWHSGGLPR